ncbi:TolB-like protein [Rhizobium sp. BK529]|uniref:tetratricopeptide repeat protein n=1 Tax=unclassified Rhizobium TaxID=2613769 RepID=UPI0010510931|nr:MULTISPECIES: hypothetical protein [unclassified Rhizobium]MBB3589905.1 TolB-like protein [Rhizobium sp. BK529]
MEAGTRNGATDASGLPVDACREQLALILGSVDFDATDRERRFLSYVVNETLCGRGMRIKAYSIAVEVFGRDASFDPQADPIVRVEAGHLRRSLERYYLTAGLADPIHISIPKGAYVPTFSLHRSPSPGDQEASAAPPMAPPPARTVHRLPVMMAAGMAAAAIVAAAVLMLWWQVISPRPIASGPERPHLAVEWFEDLSGKEGSAALARGLTQEVVSGLSKFKDIVVVQSPGPETERQVRYVLGGSLYTSADTFRLQVSLRSSPNGTVLWAASYDGATTVGDLLKSQADIASNVATTLAQAYGVIFQADAKRAVPNPPDDWAAYACTLSYYSYRASFDGRVRPSVRSCLEKAVERFPDYATAWALLSLTLIDEARFGYPIDPVRSPALIDQALTAARRAVELEPLNVRGLQAQMFALYLRKEVDAAMKVGARAISINPNDTELMGEYGYRLAMSGNWNEGCALVAKAWERNAGPPAYYEAALALCSYFHGDYEEAAMWIRKADVPANALYHVIAIAIFAETGDEALADRERAWLVEHEPALVRNLRAEAALRFTRPEDIASFLGSLKKAGLQFSE